MAILDSWAVGTTADRKVGTEDARRAIGALWAPGNSPINARVGLRPTTGDPGKVAATGTPGPNVTVNAFQAVLDLAARPGAYIATMDATLTVPILDVPADPSNQRNDLIIAQQSDADYGDANRNFQVVRVQGTPSGSPSDPTPSGSPNYLTLARVRVTAGATTITNGMIDDLRPGWIAALGGVQIITGTTQRAALSAYDGMPIWRLDRAWLEVAVNPGWRVVGVAHCASTANRDSAITDPYNGQLAVTTDTGTLWVRHAGAWARVPGLSVTDRQATGFGTTTSTSYTSTLTGGTVAGVAFTAPPSGQVNIHNAVYNFNSGANATFCTIRVRTGNVVGSGTDVLADDDNNALINNTASGLSFSRNYLLAGLTAGSAYNVQQRVKVSAGTGTFHRHAVIVTPD